MRAIAVSLHIDYNHSRNMHAVAIYSYVYYIVCLGIIAITGRKSFIYMTCPPGVKFMSLVCYGSGLYGKVGAIKIYDIIYFFLGHPTTWQVTITTSVCWHFDIVSFQLMDNIQSSKLKVNIGQRPFSLSISNLIPILVQIVLKLVNQLLSFWAPSILRKVVYVQCHHCTIICCMS